MWPSPTSPTHFIPSAPEPHSQSVLQSPLPVDPYSGAHEQEFSANDPGIMDPYGVPERPRAAYPQFDHQWVPGHALNYPVGPEANAADQSFPSGASNQARYPSPASSGASTPDACWSDCSSSPGDVDYQSGSANGVGGNATISLPMVVTDSTPSASISREHARYPTAEWDRHVPNRQSKYGANTNQAQAYYDSSASYAPVEASAYNLYETTQTSLQAHVGVTGHYQPTPHAAGSHSQVSWSDPSREDTVLPEQQPIQEQERGRLAFEAGWFNPGHNALVPLVVPPVGHWRTQGAHYPSQPWSGEYRHTEESHAFVAPPHALGSAWSTQDSTTITPMALHGEVVNAGASGPLSTGQTGPKRRERQRKPKLPGNPRACARCREKKTRCRSNGVGPCYECIRAGAQCVEGLSERLPSKSKINPKTCEQCRRMKKKCEPTPEGCSMCTRRNVQCSYHELRASMMQVTAPTGAFLWPSVVGQYGYPYNMQLPPVIAWNAFSGLSQASARLRRPLAMGQDTPR